MTPHQNQQQQRQLHQAVTYAAASYAAASTIKSNTNDRLRRPDFAASLAERVVMSNPKARAVREVCSHWGRKTAAHHPPPCEDEGTSVLDDAEADGLAETAVSIRNRRPPFRVLLGLGPGRSGTQSLSELLGSQIGCVRCEHEMIVPRGGEERREKSEKKKGSWGADRRLEWDAPRLPRGMPQRTEEEAASWRVKRLLEQRDAWLGWVQGKQCIASGEEAGRDHVKPRKLGARGWRQYNMRMRNRNDRKGGNGSQDAPSVDSLTLAAGGVANTNEVPVVASVSSVGLAYVHEYVALDPTVRIVVVMRPREEVVASFLRKSVGRNHWQRHERQSSSVAVDVDKRVADRILPDKTWDNAFPIMTDDECRPFASATGATSRPDKAAALRAYWELYNTVANELEGHYPDNVCVFHSMDDVLNDSAQQEALLRWCGFERPILDITDAVRLNRSSKTSLEAD